MMPEHEMEFQLLLGEVEHANQQIGGYMDLQVKILGSLFSALGVGLGLLFAVGKTVSSVATAKVLVALSLVASFGVIQSSISYGIALGYMHYKTFILAPKLRELLKLL